MPSRKKAKGKARKAAKEARAKEEESRAVAGAASQRQGESVEAMMQRLTICSHGCPSVTADEEKIVEDFMNAFLDAFRLEDKVGPALVTAHDATVDEYANVYASKLDTVISILLCHGAQYILDGDNKTAQLHAYIVTYFEDFMAVYLHKTQATVRWAKIVELCDADDHTLVSYYRKRIPCSCLDETYKRVKSVKKMGFCYNPSCSQPRRKVERSRMFSCTRCGAVNYCSVECQKNHWKEHKKTCNRIVEQKAVFNSNQT